MSFNPIPIIIPASIIGFILLIGIFRALTRSPHSPEQLELQRKLEEAMHNAIRKQDIQTGRRTSIENKWEEVMTRMLSDTEDGRKLMQISRQTDRRGDGNRAESGGMDDELIARLAEAVTMVIIESSEGNNGDGGDSGSGDGGSGGD